MGMSLGGGGGLNSEINVTPLVDVMLVLLAIFMITAPMLQTGVDIDLPETKAQETKDPDDALVLSISKGHQLFLGGAPVKWKELETKLRSNAKIQAQRELFIEADKDLPYSVVVTAMAEARTAGVTKLQMLTDQAAKLDLDALEKEAAPTGGSGGE